MSIADAAKLMSVSARMVERTRRVLREGAPELTALVKAGLLKCGPAEDILCLSHDDQSALAILGPSVVRAAAAEVRASLKANKNIAGEPLAGALEMCQRAMTTLARISEDDDDLHEGLRRVIDYCRSRLPD